MRELGSGCLPPPFEAAWPVVPESIYCLGGGSVWIVIVVLRGAKRVSKDLGCPISWFETTLS